jgi:outer membrane lipoprotein
MQRCRTRSHVRRAGVAIVALLLAACATRAPIDTTAARLDLPPFRAAEFDPVPRETVVWGGMIIDVDNRERTSEITVLAYPLDRRHRPILKAPTEGRFIAVVPGYLERYDWPAGRFLTLRGTVRGKRDVAVGEHAYAHAVVDVESLHLWPVGFQHSGPKFSIGVGVGIR